MGGGVWQGSGAEKSHGITTKVDHIDKVGSTNSSNINSKGAMMHTGGHTNMGISINKRHTGNNGLIDT